MEKVKREKRCEMCPVWIACASPDLCPKCTDLVSLLNSLWLITDKGDD